jgi:hypothetical protein
MVQGDPSTYAWSENPILCLLAYLTDASGGMGEDYSRRIAPALDSWIAAADDCDAFGGDGRPERRGRGRRRCPARTRSHSPTSPAWRVG